MFKAVLFTTAQTVGKQPKCLLREERLSKKWCIHTKEYHSAVTRKKILQYATRWTHLEAATLSEISQSRKDKWCMMLLI